MYTKDHLRRKESRKGGLKGLKWNKKRTRNQKVQHNPIQFETTLLCTRDLKVPELYRFRRKFEYTYTTLSPPEGTCREEAHTKTLDQIGRRGGGVLESYTKSQSRFPFSLLSSPYDRESTDPDLKCLQWIQVKSTRSWSRDLYWPLSLGGGDNLEVVRRKRGEGDEYWQKT